MGKGGAIVLSCLALGQFTNCECYITGDIKLKVYPYKYFSGKGIFDPKYVNKSKHHAQLIQFL